MAKNQKLARFYPANANNFRKCFALFEKIENAKRETGQTINTICTKDKIRALKRSVETTLDHDANEIWTLDRATAFLKDKNVILRIWKQENYKKPIFLELESNLTGSEESDDTRVLNLFRIWLIIQLLNNKFFYV